MCNNEENCDQIWVEKADLEGVEEELLVLKSSEKELEPNNLKMGMGLKQMFKKKATKCNMCKFAVKKLVKKVGKDKNKVKHFASY